MEEKIKRGQILEKLLAGRKLSELSDTERVNLDKMLNALMRSSSRHHFIPQHYIRGFTNASGLLYVYDIKKDEIKRNPIGPNGIFFEKDLHSIEIGGIKTSILEDVLMGNSDTMFAKCIRDLRESEAKTVLNSQTTTGMASAFVVDLFWRNPCTNEAFEDLYERSEIKFTDKKTGREIKDEEMALKHKADPVNRKLARSTMTLTAINQVLSKKPGKDLTAKLWEYHSPCIILGDNPIIFRQTPSTQEDLFLMDYFLPISSTRLFANHSNRGLGFTQKDCHFLNAVIIAQSSELVCSGCLETLHTSVKLYHGLKKRNMLESVKEARFLKTNLGKT